MMFCIKYDGNIVLCESLEELKKEVKTLINNGVSRNDIVINIVTKI